MLRHLSAMPRLAGIAFLLAGSVMLPIATTPSLAATDGVTCGVITSYTAPDPAGPTDGTITIGLDQVETIAAAATISAAVTASVPTLLNTSPTCLSITADAGGVITSLDFAPSGTVCGTVELDSSGNFYVVARAFIIPTALVDSEVAFKALFGVSFATGDQVCVTFTVDTTAGVITAFSGTTSVCGDPVAHPDGSVDIGPATVPSGVLAANGLAAETIAETAGDAVCADIRSAGTVDTSTGNIVSSAEATVGFDHCGAVRSGAAGMVTVDGLPLTAAASVPSGVRGGMHIEVVADAPGTIVAAAVAGCAAPVPPPTTLPNASVSAPAGRGSSDLFVPGGLAALSAVWMTLRVLRRHAFPRR